MKNEKRLKEEIIRLNFELNELLTNYRDDCAYEVIRLSKKLDSVLLEFEKAKGYK